MRKKNESQLMMMAVVMMFASGTFLIHQATSKKNKSMEVVEMESTEAPSSNQTAAASSWSRKTGSQQQPAQTRTQFAPAAPAAASQTAAQPQQFMTAEQIQEAQQAEIEAQREQEAYAFEKAKVTDFLKNVVGMSDAQIESIHFENQSIRRELRDLQASVHMNPELTLKLKRQAVRRHHEWMTNQLGAENYQKLTEFQTPVFDSSFVAGN